MLVDILFIILLFFIFQFILFRIKFIYKISLLTRLYDFARWIKNEPKVLIMGSSFARKQISPEIISSLSSKYNYNEIFNIGNDAATPFQMYITFMKNKSKFKKLDLVYHTLDPHILGEKYYAMNKFEVILLGFKQWNFLFRNHKNYMEKSCKLKYYIFFSLFYYL